MSCLSIYARFCPLSFDTNGIEASEIKIISNSYRCNFYNSSFSINSLVYSSNSNIYLKQSII
jgi:hypothetical protein